MAFRCEWGLPNWSSVGTAPVVVSALGRERTWLPQTTLSEYGLLEVHRSRACQSSLHSNGYNTAVTITIVRIYNGYKKDILNFKIRRKNCLFLLGGAKCCTSSIWGANSKFPNSDLIFSWGCELLLHHHNGLLLFAVMCSERGKKGNPFCSNEIRVSHIQWLAIFRIRVFDTVCIPYT